MDVLDNAAKPILRDGFVVTTEDEELFKFNPVFVRKEPFDVTKVQRDLSEELDAQHITRKIAELQSDTVVEPLARVDALLAKAKGNPDYVFDSLDSLDVMQRILQARKLRTDRRIAQNNAHAIRTASMLAKVKAREELNSENQIVLQEILSQTKVDDIEVTNISYDVVDLTKDTTEDRKDYCRDHNLWKCRYCYFGEQMTLESAAEDGIIAKKVQIYLDAGENADDIVVETEIMTEMRFNAMLKSELMRTYKDTDDAAKHLVVTKMITACGNIKYDLRPIVQEPVKPIKTDKDGTEWFDYKAEEHAGELPGVHSPNSPLVDESEEQDFFDVFDSYLESGNKRVPLAEVILYNSTQTDAAKQFSTDYYAEFIGQHYDDFRTCERHKTYSCMTCFSDGEEINNDTADSSAEESSDTAQKNCEKHETWNCSHCFSDGENDPYSGVEDTECVLHDVTRCKICFSFETSSESEDQEKLKEYAAKCIENTCETK